VIRPEHLRLVRFVRQYDEGFPRKELHAIFDYKGHEYDLKVTDPHADTIIPGAWPGIGGGNEVAAAGIEEMCLCVSLTPPYGWGGGPPLHYKVVATLLKP
jgi:hypothetical protein